MGQHTAGWKAEVDEMKIAFQTAFITGSSRGIGRGIAVKLAREGVKKIAVHYLTRQDEAEKTVAQLQRPWGGRCARAR